jgi:hypothetical protein
VKTLASRSILFFSEAVALELAPSPRSCLACTSVLELASYFFYHAANLRQWQWH